MPEAVRSANQAWDLPADRGGGRRPAAPVTDLSRAICDASVHRPARCRRVVSVSRIEGSKLEGRRALSRARAGNVDAVVRGVLALVGAEVVAGPRGPGHAVGIMRDVGQRQA